MARALRLTDTLPDYKGLELKEIKAPVGEVNVRVKAAAVNYVDLLQSRGGHQHKPDLPFILGSDFAGERTDTGEPVWGMWRGAFADEIAVPEAAISPKPAGWSFAKAAAFGQPYLTALVALKRHAFLQPGEWLLVHGATAGVGAAAVDLGKRMGARVIATSSSDEKLAKIEELYAPDAVLNVKTDFRERVKEITGGGAHVVYDPVGGDIFTESLRCTRYFGRVLIIGFASGTIPQLQINYPLIKGLQIIGVRAGEYGRRFPEHGREDREHLAQIALEEQVSPHVHAEFALEDWREAFAMMERRDVIGRVVLRP
ncbi:NADPH:quinone oxidoreductase [Pacificimonas flava]|uniref:NADPH:quinone oxidoreductase n=2 Tax=Pacificimonas TaxID=1960290 RepID=A0A219B0V4_9SPHN|nr:MULTISPECIES: NADPH:quinone oxidoreductase family protein [Pacificimonas]MBZ6379803.1 NADPH:quinone oxidoreductase family protein [Pacificimonas aurantium]OWV31955.1 NADPH:quinone oxidoreductase [Pacificimonas flava]